MAFLFQNDETSNSGEVCPPPIEKHQDLLIFGYHCKLFRDDDRALAIDSGKHLIPWMGDSSLKIDRYDGRGHLFDLRPFDADNVDAMGELGADEIRIERLCEEERYLELHTDLAEKAIQEEEEIKRLNTELAETSGYTAVGFSYDQPAGGSDAAGATNNGAVDNEEEEDDDVEFVPPKELCLPRSMLYPTGTKLNALIEKTAKFVSSHGGQMEIMIKTKQSNNPQFQFINFEHSLNPYYKHQVFMIKSGRYNPDIHNKPLPKPAVQADEEDMSDEEYSGYLHPSLLAKSASQPSVPAVAPPQYTQSQLENTAYGKLLKKMVINQPQLTNSPQRSVTPTYSETDSTSQAGLLDVDEQLSRPSSAAAVVADAVGPAVCPQDTGEDSQGYDENIDGYSYDAYYGQYYSGYGAAPPPPPDASELPRPSSPPEELKPLIDRLITYVKRDGEAFEKKVIAKKDERFSFLEPGDVYYNYYNWRKKAALAERQDAADGAKSKGVSFSIKQKEPEASSVDPSRVALPVDPESDDENAQETNGAVETLAPTNVCLPEQSVAVRPSLPPPNPNRAPKDRTVASTNDSLHKKLAEQKLRDKLAAAAREKMTQVTQNTKDKSLQAERKRKAAMFVNMLKKKSTGPAIGPELPPDRLNADIESRLTEDVSSDVPDLSHQSHSRSRSPPPSAYNTVRTNRNREYVRRRDARDPRHGIRRQPDHSSRSSGHRKRRSPSPPRSSHRQHRRQPQASSSYTDVGYGGSDQALQFQQRTAAATALPSRLSEYPASETESLHHMGDANMAHVPADEAEGDVFMLKVRKMLKASRQTIYKEDLFGN